MFWRRSQQRYDRFGSALLRDLGEFLFLPHARGGGVSLAGAGLIVGRRPEPGRHADGLFTLGGHVF